MVFGDRIQVFRKSASFLASLLFGLNDPPCGDGTPPQLRKQHPASTGSGVEPARVTTGLLYVFVFVIFIDLLLQ